MNTRQTSLASTILTAGVVAGISYLPDFPGIPSLCESLRTCIRYDTDIKIP
jgi:hypothetical protein